MAYFAVVFLPIFYSDDVVCHNFCFVSRHCKLLSVFALALVETL